ncbi:YtoQ family protein [Colwellia ponticola]|uniref:YtoQ family protein n=1 Tax=Colwellia ponticola TaxID=2304625 RepID=UPI001CA425FA|nr:YtoQ family protein [Colwellia ponticola]
MKRWYIYPLEVIRSDCRQQKALVCRYFPTLLSLEHVGQLLASVYHFIYRFIIYNNVFNSHNAYWPAHLYSHVTSLTAHTLTSIYNVAVMVLGDQYKQWNAEFTTVYCTALGKPSNTLHGGNIVSH